MPQPFMYETAELSHAVIASASETEAIDKQSSAVIVRNSEIAVTEMQAPISFIELCEELMCPICQEQLKKPTTAVDCLHNFCHACILGWMHSSVVCPMCRLPIRALRSNPIVNTLLDKIEKTRKEHQVSSKIDTVERPAHKFLNVLCHSCNANVTFELHFHCASCADGNYDICLACYKSGLRCLDMLSMLPCRQSFHSKSFETGWQARKWNKATGEIEVGIFCSRCRSCCTSNTTSSWFYACDICVESPPLPCIQQVGIRDAKDGTPNSTMKTFFCHDCILRGNHCNHQLEKSFLFLPEYEPSFQKMPLEPYTYTLENYGWYAEDRVISNFNTIACYYYCDACGCKIVGPVDSDKGTIYYHCTQCLSADFDVCQPCYLKLKGIDEITSRLSKLGADDLKNRLKCTAGHDISTMMIMPNGKRQRLAH